MVISEVDPGSLHHLNWRPLRQMIHGCPDNSDCQKGFMFDVKVFELQHL